MTEYGDLENVEQLVTDLEEAEDQIDQLQKENTQLQSQNSSLRKDNSQLQEQMQEMEQKNSALQKKSSALSSQASMLKSELQKKSEKIVQLNEFDRAKIMEENIILRHKNEALENQVQKVLDETKKRISDSKAYCDSQHDDLKKRQSELEERQKQEDLREQNMDAAVAKTARKLTEAERAELRNQYQDMQRHLTAAYQAKKNSLFASLTAALLYGILVSSFTGLQKRTFLEDTAAGFWAVWGIIMKLWKGTSKIFITANALRLVIPNLRVGYIVSQILAWLGYVGGMAALILLLGIGVYFAVIGVEDYFDDTLNQFAAATAFAVLVWFGDPIRQFTHCNLFLMWLILQGGYAAVKAVIKRRTDHLSSKIVW